MKTKTRPLTLTAITLGALFYALSTQAHNPEEHMKNAEKPNCSAMKNMEHSNMDHNKMGHSKMDMDDPVIQAMMKQCMKNMHDDNGEGASHDDHKKEPNDHNSEHQH